MTKDVKNHIEDCKERFRNHHISDFVNEIVVSTCETLGALHFNTNLTEEEEKIVDGECFKYVAEEINSKLKEVFDKIIETGIYEEKE